MDWEIELFWVDSRKIDFYLKSAHIQLHLLELLKRNIYQIQPGELLKAPCTEENIFFLNV